MAQKRVRSSRFQAYTRVKPPIQNAATTADRIRPTICVTETRMANLKGKHFKQEQNRYDLHVREYFSEKTLSALKIPDIDGFKQYLLTKPASVAVLSVEEGETTFHRVDDKSRPRLSPDTVRKTLALCRAVVNHAIRCQMYDGTNPFGRDRGLKMPRPQNKGERFLTPEEAKLFLDKLEQHSPQLRDMAYLSLKTGLRSTEFFKLRGGDADFNAGVLWVEAKGGKRQQVFADKDILEMLQSYGRKPNEMIFQSRTGEQLKQISDTFLRVADALGLNDGVTDSRQKVWFHTLRHTFASWMAQSGTVTLHELRDLMRHDTITMTER